MAGFTRVHGDYVPVLRLDANAYSTTTVNATTSAATVQPQGPKLEFGTVTFTGIADPTAADINTAIITIQQLSTIAIYEFTATGSNASTLGLAVYPIGGWDFTNAGGLDAALTAALGYAVTTSTSATFTN